MGHAWCWAQGAWCLWGAAWRNHPPEGPLAFPWQEGGQGWASASLQPLLPTLLSTLPPTLPPWKNPGTQMLKRELKNGDRSVLRPSLERAPQGPRGVPQGWVGQEKHFLSTFPTPLRKVGFLLEKLESPLGSQRIPPGSPRNLMGFHGILLKNHGIPLDSQGIPGDPQGIQRSSLRNP